MHEWVRAGVCRPRDGPVPRERMPSPSVRPQSRGEATGGANRRPTLLTPTMQTQTWPNLLQSAATMPGPPLGWVCRRGRAAFLKPLVQRGADPIEGDAEPWATPRRGRRRWLTPARRWRLLEVAGQE